MIQMAKQNSPLTDEAVCLFEAKFGIELPTSYRKWLKSINGRFPSKTNYFISKSDLPGFPCSVGVEWFLSIDEIDKALKSYGIHISCDLVPIGEDGDGNFTCIMVSGHSKGAIYFWVHDQEPSAYTAVGIEPPWATNIYRVASSFDEFSNALASGPVSF